MEELISKKKLAAGLLAIVALIMFLIINPFSNNDGGNRTVVQRTSGEQFVQFSPGLFYAGFFAKETEWPNQISVTYTDVKPRLSLEDNSIEIGKINIMFSDGTKADVTGIAQFILPSDPKDMILLHNTHRTPESLVSKRLATFVQECLQSSAQEMTSDKHYGGGRAQMAQNYQDQLKNGIFISKVVEKILVDPIDHENKRLYITEVQIDATTGLPKRKPSAIEEYAIGVGVGSITSTDYEEKIDDKLAKIIDAATKSAVSRQELMTAQQQALTAEAEGKKDLVKIEYEQKQEQTKRVVAAQTLVQVAEQDKLQQKTQAEAAKYEAMKRQTLADVAAYEKRTTIQANGALELKLDTWLKAEQFKWEAFSKFNGNLVPQIQTGNSGGQTPNALNFMELMGMKAAKDLALDLNPVAGRK